MTPRTSAVNAATDNEISGSPTNSVAPIFGTAKQMKYEIRKPIAPPTLGYGEPDAGLDLDYVPDGPRPLRARQNGSGPKPATAISNSFGFGGHNAVLCLGGAA